ncbi:SdpA family antimicrobial peptide system protein [Peribacillus sp. NPDC097295]|uniref:SdpA family antimicrobial peptide system protein n=1 Tax=Peribacillus sp. NPDC097295 TaxID=3364402 RepID=UPI0038060CD5
MSKLSNDAITFLISILFFFLLFFYGIMQIMPNNPIKHLPLSNEIHIYSWFPQGWGFYSKDPRDTTFTIINMQTGELAVQWPNNRVDNLFGINRKGRSQGIEAGRISSKVTVSDWKEVKGDPVKELKKMKSITVDNDSPNPTILGDVGIIFQESTPWNWAKNKDLIMPSKIVRVKVND